MVVLGGSPTLVVVMGVSPTPVVVLGVYPTLLEVLGGSPDPNGGPGGFPNPGGGPQVVLALVVALVVALADLRTPVTVLLTHPTLIGALMALLAMVTLLGPSEVSPVVRLVAMEAILRLLAREAVLALLRLAPALRRLEQCHVACSIHPRSCYCASPCWLTSMHGKQVTPRSLAARTSGNHAPSACRAPSVFMPFTAVLLAMNSWSRFICSQAMLCTPCDVLSSTTHPATSSLACLFGGGMIPRCRLLSSLGRVLTTAKAWESPMSVSVFLKTTELYYPAASSPSASNPSALLKHLSNECFP